MPAPGAWLENELAVCLSLDGPWSFSLAGGPTRELAVPAAWEAHGADKLTDGPARYWRSFSLPDGWAPGSRAVLAFGAVSFDCRVWLNGAPAGAHRGLWSPFQLDVTDFVHTGENQIAIEVWKPGPRYPPREGLAGFLPDVATTFGGLWQSVRLSLFKAALADLCCVSRPDGGFIVSGAVAGADPATPFALSVELTTLDGAAIRTAAARLPSDAPRFEISLDVAGLPRWSAASPALLRLRVSASQAGQPIAEARRRVGLRAIGAAGGQAQLDGRPLHLRGVLDWGWQPERICPTPDRASLLRQFAQARSLGFNLVKLCLFVPDDLTFDLADEAGLYLWLEMPLWLPRLTAALRSLALDEYGALFQRLHHHPSIVVLSLGCELNAQADAEFLAELFALARSYFPNALLCDNSGSAEAYGGVSTALSDFYDYHFYSDPHFFTPLVEHFDRPARPARPWLYGEFCDADTGRDFSALPPQTWWLQQPVALERDDFLATRDYRQRLAAAGVTDGGQGLTRIARRQATAVRQFILEQTRQRAATGGYVISGWADTPITTSGVVDDRGQLKFEPAEWQRFNADAVLLLDRERRRRWVSGGDRPAYRDPFSWWAGERPELHLLLSNGLGPASGGQLNWRLSNELDGILEQGQLAVGPQAGGEVTELALIRPSPQAATTGPLALKLSAALVLALPDGSAREITNEWKLWVVPPPVWPAPLAIDASLLERLGPLPQAVGAPSLITPAEARPGGRLLTANLTADQLAWVAAGGQAVWWLTEPDGALTRAAPFWREVIHVFEPHAIWRAVPQPGYADMRFFSVASELALDPDGLQARLGPAARCVPVWRRFDARALRWAAYLIEVQYAAGRLWVASLRFAGGAGRQPAGLDANPWGAWLLAGLLKA